MIIFYDSHRWNTQRLEMVHYLFSPKYLISLWFETSWIAIYGDFSRIESKQIDRFSENAHKLIYYQ